MVSNKLEAVEQAYRTCTWGNTTETPDLWMSILDGTDESSKKRLFKKFFLEYLDGCVIRKLFSEMEIRTFLSDFKKPMSRSHLERRRKVWRYLYLGERTPIPELDWIIGK